MVHEPSGLEPDSSRAGSSPSRPGVPRAQGSLGSSLLASLSESLGEPARVSWRADSSLLAARAGSNRGPRAGSSLLALQPLIHQTIVTCYSRNFMPPTTTSGCLLPLLPSVLPRDQPRSYYLRASCCPATSDHYPYRDKRCPNNLSQTFYPHCTCRLEHHVFRSEHIDLCCQWVS